MDFAIASPTTSSILAEIALTQGDGANEMEGVTLPEELPQPESLNDVLNQGCLRGEAKTYTFVKEQECWLAQKLTNFLSDVEYSHKPKLADSKNSEKTLSFKESLFKDKEPKMLEKSIRSETFQLEETKKTYPYKTCQMAKHCFEKAELPQGILRLKETPLLRQQQSLAKTLERRLHNAFAHKDTLAKTTESNKRTDVNAKREHREKELREIHAHAEKFEKYEEKEQQQQQRQRRDEEEGFAEGERQQQQQQHEERDEGSFRVEKSAETFAEGFASYAAQESILSEIFKMRVTQFDVLLLFIEILKLEIRGREQERLSRRQERELQIMHMQKVVDNYKEQGKWLLGSSLTSGILAIVSGAAPIIGQTQAGEWIKQTLGGVFSSLNDVKKIEFFKGLQKMTFAMSEMSKSSGEIQKTFSEGNRTYDQHMSDLYRTDCEETTRSLEDIKDYWKGVENFLYETLRMYHEAIRQLYNH